MTTIIDTANLPRDDAATPAGPDPDGEDSTGTGERMDVAPSDREQELARMDQVKRIQAQTQNLRADLVGAGHVLNPQMGRQTRPYVWSDGQVRMPFSNRNALPLPLKR
jgi:hypothetical protein